MARRVIYVGGIEDLERVCENYRNRIVPSGAYIIGQYCDATPEAALLKEDFYHCARRAKLTNKQQYACLAALRLRSLQFIADQMGITKPMVFKHLRAGFAKLDALGPNGLGVFTQIVESCGGWEAVYHYVTSIGAKKPIE